MNPNDFAAHIRSVFGRYADAPVWVAWEARAHADPSKPPIKVPINPHTGYPASVTDPATWGPVGKAIAAQQRGALAGVGVVLGPDPTTNPDNSPDKPFLVGVDYDNALRADGTLMPWAQDMMLDNTYSEISPSGTGVKAFAVVDRRPEGLPHGQDGVTLKLGDIQPAVAGKRPGVEVYTGRRWFAVTGQTFRDTAKCRIADMSARLPVLLRHSGAMLAPTGAAPLPIPTDPDHAFTAQDARDAHATPLDHDARARLTHALQTHDDLSRALVGADWADRSMALFTAADLSKGYRLTFEQFVHGLMASTGAAASHVREQGDPYRALARAWDRSPQPMPLPTPDPIPAGAQLGDRPGVAADGYQQPMDLSILDQPNPMGTPYTLPLDLYDNPPPLPKFVLADMLPSAPTALVGTGGVLKSTIWMAMALNMILDRPQWGKFWWQGGSALMMSKEDERDIMLRRLHDQLHGMNVTKRQYQDIIARRFYLDDMTANQTRLVESDGKGNLVVTPAADLLIDKYRGRNVSFACMDPMVNFGPGEAHGNDGAALMMQVAWRMTRGLADDDGRCNLTFIHHLSMAAARDEVEDAHAGRSASAIGDNARSVWVLHRHKVTNQHRHVAPPSIPVEAIDRGDVIRMIMAKNSYARRIMEPYWAWRESDAIHFIEPMAAEVARAAAAAMPTPAEQQRQERDNAYYQAMLTWAREQTEPFTRAALMANHPGGRNVAGRQFDAAVDAKELERACPMREVYRIALPQRAAAYGF